MENKQAVLELSMTEVLAWLGVEINRMRKFRCLHPDHEDHHPSASLLPGDRYVYCHSCQTRGSTIDAVRWVLGFGFADAVRWLEAQSGIIFVPGKPPVIPKIGEGLPAIPRWSEGATSWHPYVRGMFSWIWAKHDDMRAHQAGKTFAERDQEFHDWHAWATAIMDGTHPEKWGYAKLFQGIERPWTDPPGWTLPAHLTSAEVGP